MGREGLEGQEGLDGQDGLGPALPASPALPALLLLLVFALVVPRLGERTESGRRRRSIAVTWPPTMRRLSSAASNCVRVTWN